MAVIKTRSSICELPRPDHKLNSPDHPTLRDRDQDDRSIFLPTTHNQATILPDFSPNSPPTTLTESSTFHLGGLHLPGESEVVMRPVVAALRDDPGHADGREHPGPPSWGDGRVGVGLPPGVDLSHVVVRLALTDAVNLVLASRF